VYLVFFSSYFKIKKISINDLDYINKWEVFDIVNNQMQKNRFFIFKQDRHFLFDFNELEGCIRNNFLLEDFVIKKEGLNSLDIFIKEKVSSFTWISNEKYYYLDIEGNIKKEVDIAKVNRNYPIIYDGGDELYDEKKAISEEYIEEVIKIINSVKRNTDFEIISFTYFAALPAKLYGKANKGFEIYFDLSSDIDDQLDRLYVLFEQGIDVERDKINYIDLRFGEKVYTK